MCVCVCVCVCVPVFRFWCANSMRPSRPAGSSRGGPARPPYRQVRHLMHAGELCWFPCVSEPPDGVCTNQTRTLSHESCGSLASEVPCTAHICVLVPGLVLGIVFVFGLRPHPRARTRVLRIILRRLRLLLVLLLLFRLILLLMH